MRTKALVVGGIVLGCLVPASAAHADPYGPLSACEGLLGKPVTGVSVDPDRVTYCADSLADQYLPGVGIG